MHSVFKPIAWLMFPLNLAAFVVLQNYVLSKILFLRQGHLDFYVQTHQIDEQKLKTFSVNQIRK